MRSPMCLQVFVVVASLVWIGLPAQAQAQQAGHVNEIGARGVAAGGSAPVIVWPAAAVVADQSGTPTQQQEATPPSEFWRPRNILVLAGIGTAAVAAVFTWHDNRDLDRRKAALEALPSTAIAEWNTEYASAQLVERSRDFWRSVALGVGGVTAGYWVTSRSDDLRPFGPPRGISVPLPGRTWVLQLNPFGRQVALSAGF